MKKILLIMVFSIAAVLFSGCATNSPAPKTNIQTTKVKVLPYKLYQKGMVVSSEKVLIASSYESKINNETQKTNLIGNVSTSSSSKKNTVTQKTLYKTVIFSKDKKYEIFINKKLKIGNMIEFILNKDVLTHILVKN